MDLLKVQNCFEKEMCDESLNIHALFNEMKFDMRASLFKIDMEANYRQGIGNIVTKM